MERRQDGRTGRQDRRQTRRTNRRTHAAKGDRGIRMVLGRRGEI
jgi:hypothetical protein